MSAPRKWSKQRVANVAVFWDGTSVIALLGGASDDRAALRDVYEKLRNTNVGACR